MGQYLNFRSRYAKPKKPLTNEEQASLFNELAMKVVKAAQHRFRTSFKLSRQELQDVRQDALVWFIEELKIVDKSKMQSIKPPFTLSFQVRNYMYGRINLQAVEYRYTLLKETRDENFQTAYLKSFNAPEIENENMTNYSTVLKQKMKQLCPTLKTPINHLTKQESYLSFLEEDYFSHNSAQDVLIALSQKYNLAPKFKKTLETEIFNNGKFYLFRLIPFLQELNITYDAKLKILPFLEFMPNEDLSLYTKLLNNFSEQRIVNLLCSKVENHIFTDSIKMIKTINQILREGAYPNINSFEEYLRHYPNALINKPKNIKEIHDWISQVHNNFKISFAQFNKLQACRILHGLKALDFFINIPETERDLITIGNTMNICVGSYAKRVKANKSFIVTLMKEDSHKICIDLDPIEFNKGEIRITQIKQKNNAFVKQNLTKEIEHQIQVLLTTARHGDS